MVLVGLFLLFLGILMLVIHLTVGKGFLVDPISVSWLANLMFIPFGVLFASFDDTNEYGTRNYVLFMYVTGTITYIIGLYSGKATFLTKILPVPSERLNLAQLWAIILISGSLFAILGFGIQLVPSGLVSVISGLNSASTGAMVLLGLYAIICYRGHFVTKLLTGLLSIAMLILMFRFYWSRRPVFAVLFSAICLFYYKKLLWRTIAVRSIFWAIGGIFAISLLLYLGATRSERVRGSGELKSSKTFSIENFQSFGGAVASGYVIFGKVLYDYQNGSEFGFQYGKTYIPGLIFWIPRSIWPSKPITGGGIATFIWYNTTEAPSNVSPSPIGEAYINFGFLGAIFIPFLAGWFVRGFNNYLINNQSSEVLWLVWFAVAPDYATQWRGDFTSMFVQAFLRVAFILILAWATKRIGSQAYEESYLLEQNELYADDDTYYSY